MGNETEPKQENPPPEKGNEIQSSVQPVVGNEWWKPYFLKVLEEPTKYILVLLFILYFIGFTIWYFYLGNNGVANIGFLKTEYISASICYVFILASVSVPPFLILNFLIKDLSQHGVNNFNKWSKYWFYAAFVWYYLTSNITAVFFPDGKINETGGVIQIIMGILLGVHLISGGFLLTKSGFFRILYSGNRESLSESNIKWKNKRATKILCHIEYFAIYFLVLTLIQLVFNTAMSFRFIISAMLFWISIEFTFGVKLKNIVEIPNKAIRALIPISIILFLIINIRVFSTLQFGAIPKSVGGGMPESAYLQISSKNKEVAESLNLTIPQCSNQSNSVYGPVGILLRSDQEILFINYSDLNQFQFTTNIVSVNYSTNANLLITNSVHTIKTNLYYNPKNFPARQIRSALVDGIIFSK